MSGGGHHDKGHGGHHDKGHGADHHGGDHAKSHDTNGGFGKWLAGVLTTPLGFCSLVAVAVIYGVVCLLTETNLSVRDGPYSQVIKVKPTEWSEMMVIDWDMRRCDYDVQISISKGGGYILKAETGQIFTSDELRTKYWFWPVRFRIKSRRKPDPGEQQWSCIRLVPTRKKGSRGIPGQILPR